MCDCNVAHRRTWGKIVHRHIVNQQGIVGRCGLRGLDGYTSVGSAVASHQHRILSIGGGTVGVERLHWHESARIDWIGHHTHLHIGIV